MKVGNVDAGQSGVVKKRFKDRLHASACWLFFTVVTSTLGTLVPAHQALAQEPGGAAMARDMLSKRQSDPNAKMLVTADELVYDYTRNEVIANGNVQIYYDGNVLEAKRVVYDRANNRLRAEGGVRLKDSTGQIISAENLDLSQQFTDGFVNSLRIDTPDNMHFTAARADRSGGDTTVLTSGAYTPCEPCKEHPEKPPLWQVKAARIIHKEKEQMIYFEDARLEFFGVPIAWVPYLSAPDPTVKRKSGFLMPKFINTSEIGYGATIPYFWNIAPNMDVTFSPLFVSKQGVLLDGEFRHRLDTGVYSIRAAGIEQQDKDEFLDQPGYRDQRGMLETHGRFNINEQWYWGWDGWLTSDETFMEDYNLIDDSTREVVSQLYLIGQGDRSYFDARTQYFTGLTAYDNQDQLPVIAPVIDYSKTLDKSVFGGEFSYDFNLTSLTRDEVDLRATSAAYASAVSYEGPANECDLTKVGADPAAQRSDCLMRGMAGTYTRLSGQADWRRTFIDDAGQVWTPFLNVRVDVAAVEAEAADEPWLSSGDESLVRAMPAVGLEYRYPFMSVESWGTQTLEPIAQIIARPDESDIGKFPNEDAQSLIFDDTNLFEINKYSGYDRVEGGGRANVGLQYIANINGAGQVNALFGQSYQLFGKNSYEYEDMANTGAESGLDQDVSDYVARVYYAPTNDLSLVNRFRFSEDDWSVQRYELEGRAVVNKLMLSATYGLYAAQPELGYYEQREGLLGTGQYKINQNWSVMGAARYNLRQDEIDYTLFGISYADECFGLTLSYKSDYTESGNRERVDTVLLTVSLRTLGAAGFSSNVGDSSSSN
ncbi:LPS-assembly protein LptD [Ancylobacter mangrovi]|uniref:LPS-assembly protein LptD n=1 Tax=Ancylobacter mangrovi TaxID=2972472 RepID=A0A9X2P7M9_9HYPH|nr:LPS-assembly protein LptD [Ancylobacter mangrovi]MCS0493619.1 LPS-assembly protein LptD [Ancylobacter mangrovi]MCS0501763.1 LPS-assembly protein LptD [Ancylobacter mangrovi]